MEGIAYQDLKNSRDLLGRCWTSSLFKRGESGSGAIDVVHLINLAHSAIVLYSATPASRRVRWKTRMRPPFLPGDRNSMYSAGHLFVQQNNGEKISTYRFWNTNITGVERGLDIYFSATTASSNRKPSSLQRIRRVHHASLGNQQLILDARGVINLELATKLQWKLLRARMFSWRNIAPAQRLSMDIVFTMGSPTHTLQRAITCSRALIQQRVMLVSLLKSVQN